jgi:hypothetical protein
MKVLAIYPSKDMKSGTCLWEANTLKEVEQFLEKHVGKVARNVCYELSEKDAVGLPFSSKREKAHAN